MLRFGYCRILIEQLFPPEPTCGKDEKISLINGVIFRYADITNGIPLGTALLRQPRCGEYAKLPHVYFSVTIEFAKMSEIEKRIGSHIHCDLAVTVAIGKSGAAIEIPGYGLGGIAIAIKIDGIGMKL